MKQVDRVIRKFLPSTPTLSANRPVMALLDLFDRGTSLPYPEFRRLPPNRFRIRVGVGNRILFNQNYFIKYGYKTWFDLLKNYVTFSDHIVDIGSGCGRTAFAVRDHAAFTGHYTGIDVDKEMVEWCSENFPSDHFTFVHANTFSKVYNPKGVPGPYRLPVDDSSVDLVFSQSLFTHLLEEDLENYVKESFRVLRPGKTMAMGVFCIENLRAASLLGGRWTFPHRVKSAYVESLQYPEAATGYERDFLLDMARRIGFSECEIRPATQSLFVCKK
jgi:SAM-dependent methyltransferase